MRKSPIPTILSVVLTAAILVIPQPIRAEDSTTVKAMFANPPRQFSSGPLWVWNDMLTAKQIEGTLQDLAEQKVRQVWVHPRPGLMTPYLGEDWFRMWKVALAEAERLDMNVWIYDENSYPSGFAGGLVPEAMPEARGRGLRFQEVNQLPESRDDIVAVYRLTDAGFDNITQKALASETLPEDRYLTASIQLARPGGWYGGKHYVDLLHPGVTEKFIEITMEAYRSEIGEHFGRRVPGWFTDEPHLTPAGGIHWSQGLAEDFQARWNYDLMDHLPSLVRPVGDWRKVRHNYQQLLLEQFIDRWAKPCYEYCEKYGLEFTGHYWEHGWPVASHGGDNMAMYAWHQRPAIDTLMNEYDTGVHAQFGNARAVKELSSVANQLGRKRTLCEAYGAGGWDLRLEDMKRIGDWLYVLGVNTLNEHLSYVTIRGARKRDHPQSFSYHAPWWEAYHTMAGYFTRLSLALSAGEQVNHVLLLEPTTTTWMYQPDPSTREQLATIGDSFQNLLNDLEKSQAEYDIGCEDILGRHGAVESSWLKIGRGRYDTVVLPPHTENLNSTTVTLLQEYIDAGGKVICCGPPPSRVDGQVNSAVEELARSPHWQRTSVEEAVTALQAASMDGLKIQRSEDDRGELFHHRRRLDDGQLLFLVNTSIKESCSGVVDAAVRGVEQWNAATGAIEPYPFVKQPEGVQTRFTLPPCGSLLLWLSDKEREPATAATPTITTLQPIGPPSVRRLEPNVLTLDYVDVTAGGKVLRNSYFYEAQKLAFVENGMDGNPWDSAVQFRDELITKEFPPASGFNATYRFTIRDRVPQPLFIVIERPDLYRIACNGKRVNSEAVSWWLDKSFGQLDLSKAARVGENTVTIHASPMTVYHELEPAYVLGDFSLQPTESGFAIVPPRPIELISIDSPGEDEGLTGVGWNQQGHPFYAAGVAYTEQFDVPKPASGSYFVSLENWYGSVAKVKVNGQVAGYIGSRPWQREVTQWIKPGKNTVEVVVIGTLKNTLGPHHAGPVVGRAWPNMFQVAPRTGPPPGEQYHTIGYGLFEPFLLQHVADDTGDT